jgi:hypothetical protein
MAITTIVDLPGSRALDYKASLAISGAGAGDWCIGAFQPYIAPVAVPSATQVFNYFEQITNNNVTYIGQMVNQTTTVDINNSGANSSINAVLLTSLNNQAPKS